MNSRLVVFSVQLMVTFSQVIGAFYYLLAIERQDTCWREACQSPLNACDLASLYCGKHDEGKTRSFLVNACPVNTDNGPFDFGIYQSVLEADVVQSRNFPEKLFYCFWWGLQNLRFVFLIRNPNNWGPLVSSSL